jgi:transcriptional antiterminator RfaH
MEPAKVDDALIQALRQHESAYKARPQKLFEVGQKVVITQGAFAGIEGMFQMSDGEQRVMVLIEIMSKQVPLRLAPHEVKSAV